MKTRWVYQILSVVLICLSAVEAHEVADEFNRVNLSVSAEREVENDLLVANLYAEHQSQNQKDVSERVNNAIRWALELSKKEPGVKVQTTQYNTSPIYNKQIISGWRARQGIRLESINSTVLSELIGDLQEKLLIGSINYGVSKLARDTFEAELTTEALRKFMERAEHIAKTLGRNGFQIVQIHVNTQGSRPVPVSYASRGLARAEASVAAPAIESGVQTVQVSVSGTVEIDSNR
ncbi:MAG: SIMPL domain-containing protein [Pseudomonadota bacterium]